MLTAKLKKRGEREDGPDPELKMKGLITLREEREDRQKQGMRTHKDFTPSHEISAVAFRKAERERTPTDSRR